MFIRFRPVQIADFAECFCLIRNGFAFEGGTDRADLLHMWRDLLNDGRMIGAVMEDAHAPLGKRIVWQCFKVFVTDDFARSLYAPNATPLASRQLLERFRHGVSLPLLDREQIRCINSGANGGLNMLVTHYGSPFPMDPKNDSWREVGGNLLLFTEYFSSGHRVRELIEEFYDDYNAQLAQEAGFCPRTEFADYYHDKPEPNPFYKPRVLAATPDEVHERPGTIAAAILHYDPPRFYFNDREQELLLSALIGETDEGIAERMNVASVTVRKRWDSIYGRVESAHPGFFGDHTDTPKRGTEKKRTLIAYLRHHHEELRPLLST